MVPKNYFEILSDRYMHQACKHKLFYNLQTMQGEKKIRETFWNIYFKIKQNKNKKYVKVYYKVNYKYTKHKTLILL